MDAGALSVDAMLIVDAAPVVDAMRIPDAAPVIDAAPLPIDAAPVVDAALDNEQYPVGPYGLEVGDVIQDLEFISVTNEPYRLSDMRREPNTRLIALPVIVAWCPVCIRLLPAMGVMAGGLRAEGVLTVLSFFEDEQFNPADHRDIGLLERDHNPPFPFVADPEQVMAPYFAPFGREKYMLIDADNMRLVHISASLRIAELEQRIRTWLVDNPAE
jgi:hypothetical protein